MTTLAGRSPQSTYGDLLQVSNSNGGIDATLRNVEDGGGTQSPLRLSATAVDIAGGFQVGGNAVSAPAIALLTAADQPGREAALALTTTPRAYTQQQNTAAEPLTDGGTITWDLNAAQAATLTLGGNRTLANPSNPVSGGTYSLLVRQDGTGGRTLAFGTAYKWAGGVAPTLSAAAGAVDLLVFYSDGASLYGGAQLAFS